MKKGGGKAKGSEFERRVCRMLSLWWTNGKEDDVFWRTSNSGGRAHARRLKGKKTANQTSDISATDKRGEPLTERFCIELKTGYGSWSFLDTIDGKKEKTSFAFQVLKQVSEERDASGKLGVMIIFRRTRRKVCIAFSKGLLSCLEGGRGVLPPVLFFSCSATHTVLCVITLEQFFETFTANDIKEIPI